VVTGTRSRNAETNKKTSWERARLSVVIPIGVIVAVAIVCIVVAVLTSAQRADEVALEQEKRLFTKSLSNHGERVLRELESVAASDQAVRSIRRTYDRDWVQRRIGLWLRSFFDHDFVFVANSADQLIYALLGRDSVNPVWFNSILPELAPTINYVRGPAGATPSGGVRIGNERPDMGEQLNRGALMQTVMGRPAVVAAVLVTLPDASNPDAERQVAPIVVSVKFIDEDVLAEVASRLQLRSLRQIGANESIPHDDFAFMLVDDRGAPIARFAWTPKRPGAEIVRSVIPFIAVALAGFAVLAGLIFGYMRRTAETIAAGEDRLRYLALHDPLCGLPNRNFFSERLEQTITEVRAGGPAAAVFYIDLDHFKDVNDTLGHPVGDELIRNVTLRLSRALRGEDIVARLGGDEFAVIMSVTGDNAALQKTADGIIAALCAPYSINDRNVVIGASIGIAVIDQRFKGEATDVLRYADIALYRAKNEGRSRACIYDAAMDADLSHRKLLETDLRKAIENDGLRLFYQPIVNASGETIVGVEALCRWTHPERGEIPPSEFIPIAENTGLIVELGEWVLRRACLDGLTWPKLIVAVNVSPLQFRRADFVDVVEHTLAQTGFDPNRLELELTESTLLNNIESAETAMHRLRCVGVRLALDDFGTGYSSLAYLRRFPFDKLKIDRSFVRSIERGSDAAAIVHAIVSLGRGLGMKVTAEGVETAEQQLFLRAAGVHFMQGYRFGRAGEPAEVATRIASPGTYRSIENDAAAAMAS
jgi:diguanylate cyclase (GGDEF)-like protein